MIECSIGQYAKEYLKIEKKYLLKLSMKSFLYKNLKKDISKDFIFQFGFPMLCYLGVIGAEIQCVKCVKKRSYSNIYLLVRWMIVWSGKG